MAERRISYTVRDFAAIRQELIDYTRKYYPDIVQNFNDASIFSVFLDLNAAVTDNLHYHIDRSIQETVLEFAQQRSSLYNIARTYGLKIPGNRPSVAVCDITINVPVAGDRPNVNYMGTIKAGSQFVGAGQNFENLTDIVFSSQFSSSGQPNQKVIPVLDTNNRVVSYNIVKREILVNGITKVFKKIVTQADVIPFLQLFLPERNVLNVTSIIQKDGINYQNVPPYSDFISPDGKWYEVPALAESRVFIPYAGKTASQGITPGIFIDTNNRYITEFTPENFMKITFGGANTTADQQLAQFVQTGVVPRINDYQNNINLGLIPTPNTTLFIQYRVGGGLESNVGVNVINTIGNLDMVFNGQTNAAEQARVVSSVQVTNVTAAVGGSNPPSIEEVRNLVTFNFSSQNRAVTIGDYYALINKMPGIYGVPAKVGVLELNNQIYIALLSQDTNGKMTQLVPEVLKENIRTYLNDFRMTNDSLTVQTAKVIDLRFEVSVTLEKSTNQNAIIADIIDAVASYMTPLGRELGQNVIVSEIRRIVQELRGVVSVSDIKIFNMVGGRYSSSQTAQAYQDIATKEIRLIDDTIFAQPTEFYQIRYDNTDIGVRVKQ
jgi:hypothetical protein